MGCRHEKEVLCEGDRPNICIPNKNRALNKVRKSSDMTHEEWLDQNDLTRMKHLEACTKCVWTKELKCLMEECWHDDMGLRPSMADAVKRLEGCIQELAPKGLHRSSMQEKNGGEGSGVVLVNEIE